MPIEDVPAYKLYQLPELKNWYGDWWNEKVRSYSLHEWLFYTSYDNVDRLLKHLDGRFGLPTYEEWTMAMAEAVENQRRIRASMNRHQWYPENSPLQIAATEWDNSRNELTQKAREYLLTYL